jgi:hypothetical protein
MTQLPAPTEAEESRVLMQYMKLRGFMFTHVKNETGRAVAGGKIRNWKAVFDYQDGVRPGFPDFVVVLPGRVIAIELKRRKGGKVSDYQKLWIEALRDAGMPAFVCEGADQAITVIESYAPLGSSARVAA